MNNNGKKLEVLVEKIQKMSNNDIDVEIKRNVEIKDDSGIKREFDVIVQYHKNKTPIITAYECKDYSTSKKKTKVDVQIIDGFIGKCIDFPQINNKVIVSSTGFTQNAIIKANRHNIVLQDLAPILPEDAGIDTKITQHHSKTIMSGDIKYVIEHNYLYEACEQPIAYSYINSSPVDIITLVQEVLKTSEYKACKEEMLRQSNYKPCCATLYIDTRNKLYVMDKRLNRFSINMIQIPIKIECDSYSGKIEQVAQINQATPNTRATTFTFDKNNIKVTHIEVGDKQDVLIEQNGNITEPLWREGI